MRIKLEKKYRSLLVYTVLAVTAAIIAYKVIDNLGLILWGIGTGISFVFNILLPLLIGAVVAYFLFRPMRWLERHIFSQATRDKYPGRTRLAMVILIYLITIGCIVAFLRVLIPSTIESIVSLTETLPVYEQEITDALNGAAQGGGFGKDLADWLLPILSGFSQENIVSGFLNNLSQSGSTSLGSTIVSLAKGTTSFVISAVAIFFSGFYILLDKERLERQFKRFNRTLMSEKVYGGFSWAIRVIDDIFYRYFAGKILTSALIGFICYVGLLILHVKYAPLIALIVGVTNVIPYFGPIFGGVVGILLTVLYDPILAIWVGVLIFLDQQFDGNVLAPNVLGKIVELGPFWVLFAAITGGSLMGPFGMFVAIPFFAVLRVFLSAGLDHLDAYKQAKALKIAGASASDDTNTVIKDEIEKSEE